MVKIAHLYYDLLNLYGENGNVKALNFALDTLNIDYTTDYLTIDSNIDFLSYDFIYLGSGTEENLNLVANDIKKYEDDIRKYIEKNRLLLATGNSLDLFGKYIKLKNDTKISTLDIFNFFAKENDKRIVGEVMFSMGSIKQLIGFFNFQNILQEEVVKNYSNLFVISKTIGFESKKIEEGIMKNNFYGTHIIGPILARNPEILRYFISRLIENVDIQLDTFKIDTDFEQKARENFIKNYYLNKKKKNLI